MENNTQLIYNTKDSIPLKHIALYGFQLLLAVLIATLLIANICNVPVGAGLIGAGCSTLIYIAITQGKSNVFISNSGAFVAPVIYAFATGGATGAIIGGLTIFIVYFLMGLLFQKLSINNLYKIIPKTLIASITILIGLSLINYIPTYLGSSGAWGLFVAFITMFVIGLTMFYGKGKLKTIPFLIGIVAGYIISLVLTLTGTAQLVDLSVFSGIRLFQIPNFNFLNINAIKLTTAFSIIIMYVAYALSCSCEIIADHQAMSAVIGQDILKEVGLGKTFIAMGTTNLLSSLVSGLGQTSYGEGTGCAAASKVASTKVSAFAAAMLILMGFCGYVQAAIASVPSAVFAGASMVLYPLISIAGFKMLINEKTNLNNTKNVLLISIPIAIGLSGISIGGSAFALSGIALALIVGIILNLVLKDKEA